MDINSLLSPQDSATQSRHSTPSQAASSASSPAPPANVVAPHKAVRRTRSSSTRLAMPPSPLGQQVFPPAPLPDRSPPTMSPQNGPTRGQGNGTPPANNLPPPRQAPTQGIDTLADLASRQHPQIQRPNAAALRSTDPYETQLSPSTMYPHVNSISRSTPAPRSGFDLTVSETPRETVKRNYADSSLSPEAQQRAMQLFAHLQESPHAYESHIQFIQLLHAGFMNHVYPPHTPDTHGDPQKYDLLKDLRSAREEMDRLFAMGEDLWAEWIQDESMLAQTATERTAVLELCRRAVEEEYGSTKLWTIFGEWVLYLYTLAAGESCQSQWNEEDQRDALSWQSVVDVWQKGAEATRWRINDSNLVWDRLLQLSMQDLTRSPSSERLTQLRALFDDRLQIPHATWDQTFQLFSGFVSKYYNANYEDIMADTVARASDAKEKYTAREELETRLQRAVESGDRNQEWTVFSEYIEWELGRNRRRLPFSLDLVNALYQRATLRFPTDVNIWEDYTFLIDETKHNQPTGSAVATLERAIRHCPWSGSLWSQYLLNSERECQSFATISAIKHKATSTGLLDAGGIEEVLKVHTTWCSYLRRRAFLPDATDEDLDVAEVGIRSAIESVQELGEKKYKSYQGDPMFRLERIYIRYLSESGSWDSARETFRGLIGRRGNSYEFWLAYYYWEIHSWGRFVQGESTADAARRRPNPSYATAVLKQAIKRTDLDWPERIMSTYIAHCEDYEDSDELQLAIIETRKAMKVITRKREKEAVVVTATQQTTPVTNPSRVPENGIPVAKRKREGEEAEANGLPNKKVRPEDFGTVQIAPAPVKRDRENATIVVKNLPRDISQVRIRQFFRDCGTINALKLLPPEDDSISAVIEFDSKEDALVAQTRDQKEIDGHTIEVQVGSGTTVFVTNFPPTADEAYIRDLFRKFGEVVDIRFPSLKFNTHRRFCYVQFKSAFEAQASTQRDGMTVGKGLQLVVKISDPSRKQERHGPVHEGREIHVSNLDWKVKEDDLQELFSKYGIVEAARIPTKVDGSSKGFGFVVFSSKEEANAALEMDQTEYHSRLLHVKASTPTGAKRQTTTIVSRVTKSPSVESNGISSQSPAAEERTIGGRMARTIGLTNIPDTVNDARIRSLVEPLGSLIKITLRPDHQGAIIEFSDINDAGRASLQLEGYEIVPGRKIHVGSVNEMLKQGAEHKVDRIQIGKRKEKTAMIAQPTATRRPAQPRPQGSRRGGLGVKRVTGPTTSNQGQPMTNSGVNTAGADMASKDVKATKTNDDFRAMIRGNVR